MNNEEFIEEYSDIAFKFDKLQEDIAEDKDLDNTVAADNLIEFIKNNSSVITVEAVKNAVKLYLGKFDFDSIACPNRLSIAVYNLGEFKGLSFIEQILVNLGCELLTAKRV